MRTSGKIVRVEARFDGVELVYLKKVEVQAKELLKMQLTDHFKMRLKKPMSKILETFQVIYKST